MEFGADKSRSRRRCERSGSLMGSRTSQSIATAGVSIKNILRSQVDNKNSRTETPKQITTVLAKPSSLHLSKAERDLLTVFSLASSSMSDTVKKLGAWPACTSAHVESVVTQTHSTDL